MRHVTKLIALLTIMSFAPQPSAKASQILVSAGDRWDQVLANAGPGDEIILMPGEHRPATADALRGSPDQPVIIRSLNPENRATIKADRFGLRLSQAEHIIVRDVEIAGATIAGIEIGFDDREDPQANELPRNAGIVIERLTVRHTGPQGHRDAIFVGRADGVAITRCYFEGWGGSAIELEDVTDASIKRCGFRGLDDHSQLAGVTVRGQSSGAVIEDCRFSDAGLRVVSLGPSRGMPESTGDQGTDAPDAPMALTEAVTLRRNAIAGGGAAVAIFDALQIEIIDNTFVRPELVVIAIESPHALSGDSNANGCVLANNLVVWDATTMVGRVSVPIGLDVSAKLLVEENLWWSPGGANDWNELGPLPGKLIFEQIVDIDPSLDERLRPTTERARAFGAMVMSDAS